VDTAPKTRADELPDLATRAEVSAYTRVAMSTLARWAMEDRGPKFVRLGRAVRYRREDVIAWVDAASAEA
jgi:excisionase family DNA binding protein